MARHVTANLLALALGWLARADAAAVSRFEWRPTDWKACSDACNKGTQRRDLECFEVFPASDAKEERVVRANETRCGFKPLFAILKQSCYGEKPSTDFCTKCPLSRDDPGKRVCNECAPGFELKDGKCSNPAPKVLLDVAVAVAPDVQWQQTWRPKLGKCLAEIVAMAGNVSKPTVSVYAVLPSTKYSYKTRAGRRLEADGDAAIVRAAITVPEGFKAATLQTMLESGFEEAIPLVVGKNSRLCPAVALGLHGSAVLCAGKGINGAESCRRAFRESIGGGGVRLPAWAWTLIVIAMLAIAAAVYVPMVRKRGGAGAGSGGAREVQMARR